ncbi:MAG: bifunctional hydroxymethylpyrimidine kinase/phosphomethylpyrimidine kinase [Bacteroides sp.]|nr:bifunctional hydroxymethylpyrimidine kinase/phosphomethylpyrimidine kinase [Roseburia sp.]MCM1346442.1 bifunctional hydroxymethylpyrimidine kinase/phosphomethylpyrimidine kinase [Bacteroides sp.]MCM1421727.1 bifunctional hydroxymethylpyrimidine kinase/phosphomethylpyrimidine kinase [Bacteroides sp.]
MRYITAMTIAGSDPSGGAGIQADIKTMSAIGVYACSAITALTVQNTVGVTNVFPVDCTCVRQQIEAVMNDIKPAVIKIGMLHNLETAKAVTESLSGYADSTLSIILDPIMVSSSGRMLISDEALKYVTDELLPMCTLVTPNIPEAEILSDIRISGNDARMEAARRILELGTNAVLVKGGHSESRVKSDLLVTAGGQEKWFSMLGVETPNTHGTGCTLSSAIAAYIALGEQLDDAVQKAKRFVNEALKAGKGMELGQGTGPLQHFFQYQTMTGSGREGNVTAEKQQISF